MERMLRTPKLPLLLVLAAVVTPSAVAGPVKPPEKPAEIRIEVAPESLSPGGEAEVTLTLDPIEGVKINRYPKIKFQVPGQEGLVGAAEIAIGNDEPPPPGQKSNYWDSVAPVKLTLNFDEAATAGDHEIQAKLTYFFCMPASGFCAPKRVPLKIPVAVE
jgi:hypothetical protein